VNGYRHIVNCELIHDVANAGVANGSLHNGAVTSPEIYYCDMSMPNEGLCLFGGMVTSVLAS
jgi:hypothetical protein